MLTLVKNNGLKTWPAHRNYINMIINCNIVIITLHDHHETETSSKAAQFTFDTVQLYPHTTSGNISLARHALRSGSPLKSNHLLLLV